MGIVVSIRHASTGHGGSTSPAWSAHHRPRSQTQPGAERNHCKQSK